MGDKLDKLHEKCSHLGYGDLNVEECRCISERMDVAGSKMTWSYCVIQ